MKAMYVGIKYWTTKQRVQIRLQTSLLQCNSVRTKIIEAFAYKHFVHCNEPKLVGEYEKK